MAFFRRRRYAPRRRFSGRRPRRMGRPRRMFRRTTALRSVNVHNFVRWNKQLDPAEDPLQLSCNFGSSGVSPQSHVFRLNEVANFAEFTALYDQYMITKVVVYFDYTPDVLNGLGSNMTESYFPRLWVKRDYDDSSTPTLLELLQSNQTKCLRFSSNRLTRSISIRPAMASEVFRSSTTTAYVQQRRKWLDSAYPDVPHFALKMVAQGLPSTNLGAFTIRLKYYLRFKNVR